MWLHFPPTIANTVLPFTVIIGTKRYYIKHLPGGAAGREFLSSNRKTLVSFFSLSHATLSLNYVPSV